MIYDFNGKKVKISDSEIQHSMRVLKLSKDEAIQMWLEDEGYLDNVEQSALEKKAKDNRITATIHKAQKEVKAKTPRERVRKENPTKEMVIAEIAKILPNFAENIEILNIGKLISFTIGEEKYEINLIQKRKPKKGA